MICYFVYTGNTPARYFYGEKTFSMKKTCFILLVLAIASATTSFVSPEPNPSGISQSKKQIRLYFAGQYTQPAGHGCTWVIEAAGYGDFDESGQLVGIGFFYFTGELVCGGGGGWGYAKTIDATTSYAGTQVTDITLSKDNDPDIIALFNNGASKSGFLSWLNSQLQH